MILNGVVNFPNKLYYTRSQMFENSSFQYGNSLQKGTNWAQERAQLGKYYQSQGYQFDGQMSNDCGPACLATAANLLAVRAAGVLDRLEVIEGTRFRPWERLPRWLPNIGGATAPWGFVKSFNALAAQENWDWRAERVHQANRMTILQQLMQGIPVTALKIWKNGGAHWVNVVRVSADKGKVYFLDPNPYLENLSPERRLQTQSWQDFYADWNRSVWWSRILGIAREAILYYRI